MKRRRSTCSGLNICGFFRVSDLENTEILWRLARVLVEKAELSKSEHEKEAFLKEVSNSVRFLFNFVTSDAFLVYISRSEEILSTISASMFSFASIILVKL